MNMDMKIWDGINLISLDRFQDVYQVVIGTDEDWSLWTEEFQLEKEDYDIVRSSGLTDTEHQYIYEEDIIEKTVPYEIWEAADGEKSSYGSDYAKKAGFGFRVERAKVVNYNGCFLAVPVEELGGSWHDDWHFYILALQDDEVYFEEIIMEEFNSLDVGEFERLYGYKTLGEALTASEYKIIGNSFENKDLLEVEELED